MHNDDILLLIAFVLFWVTFLLNIRNSKNKKGTILIHLIPHLGYSIYFLYQLFFNAAEGSAITWWFYLLFLLTMHWLVMLTSMAVAYFKPKLSNT